MNDYLFTKVSKYYTGNMSHKERLLFEEEIKTNTELAAICELYKAIEEGTGVTEEHSEEEIRNSLKEIHLQYLTNESKTPVKQINDNRYKNHTVTEINHWKRLAIAAVVIVAISIIAVWYLIKKDDTPVITNTKQKIQELNTDRRDTSDTLINNNLSGLSDSSKQKTTSPPKSELERLYANNFKKETIPANVPPLIQNALEYYRNNQYKDAIAAIDITSIKSSLEDLRPRGEQNTAQELEEKQTIFYAHFYKALSYMADDKTEKAIPNLRAAVTISPDKQLQSKSHWYLALAYIKTDKIPQAEFFLRKLSGANGSEIYKQKAINILVELKRK